MTENLFMTDLRNAPIGDGGGVLDGMQLVVKDCIAVQGLPHRAASPAINDTPAPAHSGLVQRVLDAGAVVIGTVNQHELSLGVSSLNEAFGPVDNPVVPGHLVGGSSGGTAAAIAAGLVPGGLGTDTGGSTRIPASLTGTYGFRPSTGRYPMTGLIDCAPTLDTPGPMGDSVATLDRLDAVITGRAVGSDAPIVGTKIAVPRNYFFDDISDEVAAGVNEFIARLREVGCEVIELEFPNAESLIDAAHTDIALPEIAWSYGAVAERQGQTLAEFAANVVSGDVRGLLTMLASGEHPSREAHDLCVANARPQLQAGYADLFASTGAIALLTPCLPITAPARQSDLAAQSQEVFPLFIRNPVAASIAGIPSLCVPAPVSGAPVGVLLDGPVGTDAQLLAFGLALEACGVFGN